MALDSFPILGPDGLTALERNRKAVRNALRSQLPDLDDGRIWQITLAVTENVPFALPPPPTSLTYAWSNGQMFSVVDQVGGIPDSGRERAVLRGLLGYALSQLDQYEISGGMIAVAHD
ncbi:hypothetical protein OG601_47400 [Streptomyces sp. NBC_01239]|uniref:hypothetical protein n=1 Tax=Streptomyces sp. NBC_01239 TaxID=2903792 RepID=UPI00224F3603|nr:hypothetical protein [Streptomyces sp. NBC_01239]MCX4816754.1 hypothetical protein [Streptomyces sp. NBC_01239]MCX4818202.1 hypothetical protein [Streptomyces sp. NBC_01239]